MGLLSRRTRGPDQTGGGPVDVILTDVPGRISGAGTVLNVDQSWLEGDGLQPATRFAFDRLKSRFNLPVKHRRPSISYRETIRGQVKQHARFKRQSGGHGQFADVQIEVWPQARGAGFEFHDRVVGGDGMEAVIAPAEASLAAQAGRHMVDPSGSPAGAAATAGAASRCRHAARTAAGRGR